MYNVSHPRHQAGAVLGRYFHPGPSTRAHRAQHRRVTTLQLQQMAAPVSSVLHTAPVSAGPPHTLHQPQGIRDTFA